MTVSPSSEPFKAGDVLTCTSDGYPEPSYKWTDSNGIIVSTTTTVTWVEGWSSLTCTATGNFTSSCSATRTVKGLVPSTITQTVDITTTTSRKYGMNFLHNGVFCRFQRLKSTLKSKFRWTRNEATSMEMDSRCLFLTRTLQRGTIDCLSHQTCQITFQIRFQSLKSTSWNTPVRRYFVK